MEVDSLPGLERTSIPRVGRVTTAEKITLGVAIAGALGVGALFKSWVDHLLARGEKRINIADKSVQIAEALMTRMEAELSRAQAALAKAEQEGEQLRAELGLTAAANTDESIRVMVAKRRLRSAYADLTEARNNIHGMQIEVGEIRSSGGLGRGLGVLIPTQLSLDLHEELNRDLREELSRPVGDQVTPRKASGSEDAEAGP
jgi:hypothetical protein